jgi:UbiD family decarboxylase
MAYKDLREFLAKLESEGELLRIKEEVHWEEEIGAISKRLIDKETKGGKAPAVIFENITGYPGGRFFTNTIASYRRYALALNLPIDTPIPVIIETWRQRVKHPIKPVILKTGPCKENIIKGKDVDLFKLPTPKWHSKDGHRYIGTFHTVIMKDPKSDWMNWGMYRMGIHDKNSTGLWVIPGQHSWILYEKYKALGKPMPLAVVIGQDPTHPIVSASPFDEEVSEVEMAGALRQAPVELVKAETSDLLVPANAEIILEGEVPTDELKMEGPFGEAAGYYGGAEFPKPVFHVKCITHRNNPIHTGSMESTPMTDDSINWSTCGTALLKNHVIDKLKIPGVKDLFFNPYAFGVGLCIVSAKRVMSGLPQIIASAIWSHKHCLIAAAASWIIVVDDDIDCTNMNEVIWALTTRSDPERSIQIIKDRGGALALVPRNSWEDRVTKQKGGSSVVIDAGFPFEWHLTDPNNIPDVLNFESWSVESREKALKILKEK